ncbi:MAG: glycoside hydrolase family 97 protein [Armatimonadota bacterium]
MPTPPCGILPPCLLLLALAASLAPLSAAEQPAVPLELTSPDRQIRLAFRLGAEGRPELEVTYRGEPVATGRLALELAGSGLLGDHLRIVRTRRRTQDETYRIPVGKASRARDQHRELVVSLEETAAPGRKLELAFRAFNDGVAFRYRLPVQKPLADFVLTEERTELTFPGDPPARLLPLDSYTTSYEKYYETRPVSEIGPQRLVGLPLLLERGRGGSPRSWLAVTEANLTDYAGMYLSGSAGRPGTLTTKLSPLPGRRDGAKVLGKTPHASPWRVLMIADHPGRLVESHLVFHLSDPPAIQDTSWIKPGKTTFPWWNGYVLEGVDFKPGVNTATMKHYIDFCAEQGIPYHSLDGLDIAWYGGPIAPVGPTDVTTAAPSIDLPELLRYAREKGVRLRLWMHWKALQPQIDEAFRKYEEWGIEGVMVDFMDRDDQEMVRFYHEMAEKAAKHHLTVTLHGSYKPTGMERTWPNVLSYEGVLNQEYNKWEQPGGLGTPPEHNVNAAFVRMLAGPLDYHQGGMRNVFTRDYRFRNLAPPVQGTRAHQLAMYVVYQNHMSMMADYPAAYRGQPGLDFMVRVPANWDETRVLNAQVGDFIVIARRQGEEWYVGTMNDDTPRQVSIPLAFLGGGSWTAEIWADDPSAREATKLITSKRTVTAADTIQAALAAGGGHAVRLVRSR